MNNLNKLELQNLRHLIGGHANVAKKLQYYGDMASEKDVQAMFYAHAKDASSTKETLMGFLN